MELLDSRRLTGRNLLLHGPGAVIDAAVDDGAAEALVATWTRRARQAQEAVGWAGESLASDVYPGGASLAMGAPHDALYAATDANEWAWDAAVADLRGDAPEDDEDALAALRQMVDEERNPRLIALRDAAQAAGVAFLADDDAVSVGSGTGSRSWPVDALPAADQVGWGAVRDVPTVLVTGTNGKTTTVRLLEAMVAEAGLCAGVASTDEVVVGGQVVERGDFSGPMGARQVLRDPRVQLAILETARGGILRRGLVIDSADVAVVTNVAEDHLGEFGVHDVAGLSRAKLLVARAVRPGGRVVLNAEDAALVEGSASLESPITWFAMDGAAPRLRQALDAGDRAVFVQGGAFVLARGAERIALCQVTEAPLTMEGRARFNVANALAAIAAADALAIPMDAVRRGLRAFGSEPGANEGRGHVRNVGGARVLVDFAHNPQAIAGLVELAAALPAERRLILLGQAGDRDDEAIRALVSTACAMRPDRVVIKEMIGLLRGRQPEEIPALIRDELLRCGVPEDAIDHFAPSEYEGVRRSLAWARPGDLLVLPIHKERPKVEALLDRLENGSWTAGEPVPE